MKELFSEYSLVKVSTYKALLEAKGIKCFIKNEYFTGVTEIPIPDLYPALCVIDDADYERALGILKESLADIKELTDEEVACGKCEEMNPVHFSVCWSCEADIS